MPVLSALTINGVPIECVNQAAIVYQVPATLLISILKVEGGHIGTASPNSNGSFDYGPMQINSFWLTKIKQYGFSKNQIQYDPCANVYVATWILGQEIANAGNDVWRGVGNYHSHTPEENRTYRYKVQKIYHVLMRYLKAPVPDALTPVEVKL